MLILAGCRIAPEIPAADLQVVALTANAWKTKGMPDAEDCVEDVGIRTVSADNFMLYCGLPAAFSYGCVADRDFGSFGHTRILYISPAVHPTNRHKAIASLTLHALCGCTTTRKVDKYDRANWRPGVWKDMFLDPKAIDTSVEGYVYSILDARAK